MQLAVTNSQEIIIAPTTTNAKKERAVASHFEQLDSVHSYSTTFTARLSCSDKNLFLCVLFHLLIAKLSNVHFRSLRQHLTVNFLQSAIWLAKYVKTLYYILTITIADSSTCLSQAPSLQTKSQEQRLSTSNHVRFFLQSRFRLQPKNWSNINMVIMLKLSHTALCGRLTDIWIKLKIIRHTHAEESCNAHWSALLLLNWACIKFEQQKDSFE